MTRAVNQITVTSPRGVGEPPFTARGAYDKLAWLVAITLLTGAVGYQVGSPISVIPALVITLGCAIACMFRPRWARVLAPTYAVVKGFFLGAISAYYATLGGGIVPAAIVLTAGFFVAALVLFRTGIVRVTPKFAAVTAIATMGLFVVYMAALVGLKLPGVDGIGGSGLVFGIMGVGIGLMNMFTDFEYVSQAEQRGAGKSGEWYAAFALLLSLVMVYVHILRVLANSQRRR